MPRSTKPRLSVIHAEPAGASPSPPSDLDGVGFSLWRDITAEYAFDDRASLEVLTQACHAASRAARCAKLINEHGELIRVGKAIRANPLLRDETACRALCCRLLQKLGCDLEPIRSGVGRPPTVS